MMGAVVGPDALSPPAAGAWRASIGGVGLLGWMWLRHRPIPIRSLAWRWVLVGGVAVAGYQLTFFDAVARTGVAVGTLVLTPVLASGGHDRAQGVEHLGLVGGTGHRNAPEMLHPVLARVEGGAEGVGKATTRSVVQAISAIIVTDMLFVLVSSLTS